MRYCIVDPTGNITALVESEIEVARQPSVGAELMRRHPEVEQVGFVQLVSGGVPDEPLAGTLRMAGGEFCGNASISAAALCLLRAEEARGVSIANQGNTQDPCVVSLRVSGAARPVEVRLFREAPKAFKAAIRMPEAQDISWKVLSYGDVSAKVPVVALEGISHIVIEADNLFFSLLDKPDVAEEAVKAWCKQLGADGLGLMFLEKEGPSRKLTPLVYVADGDTVFWEHSCASGSAATALYLAERLGAFADEELVEPGGSLRVTCDPTTGETWLYGSARIVEEASISQSS
ncbi:MAG: hypothetical protein IKE22_04030 [Atopobiaceae bacterium]|nr:hypothetical protein [Atopobiaceae bacterium]